MAFLHQLLHFCIVGWDTRHYPCDSFSSLFHYLHFFGCPWFCSHSNFCATGLRELRFKLCDSFHNIFFLFVIILDNPRLVNKNVYSIDKFLELNHFSVLTPSLALSPERYVIAHNCFEAFNQLNAWRIKSNKRFCHLPKKRKNALLSPSKTGNAF